MTSTEINDSKNVGIIILAAGGSSRLGTPKQLLLYNGQILLQHCLDAAITSKAHPIVVVLGAYATDIKKEIKSSIVHAVINNEWQEGMASSIRCGIKLLDTINPFTQGAILMVCDQPFVTSLLLQHLITTHQNTGKPIVACNYENTFGPPVFFHQSLFRELLQLKGDMGAKKVVRQHASEMETVLFPEGSIDIDTADDYQKLSKNNHPE